MFERPNWRTSSYTKSDSCVEVADNDPKSVMVRDTKRRAGGTLTFSPSCWEEFVNFSKRCHV
ncbi:MULTISPECIES: DUF397 domain-containing protein [Streptomyces]|uniref:DUF397 domain-containing protein n=1 Tax=Streptomyces TaxID=1883 RepID=UPI0009973E96|nr:MULTISPECIES: DUF397 domain-containing protein [Streptomyces]